MKNAPVFSRIGLILLALILFIALIGRTRIAKDPELFLQMPATVRCVNNLPEVTLSWMPAENAISYTIQRKTSSTTSWSTVSGAKITTTAHTDLAWENEYPVTFFDYRIMATIHTTLTRSLLNYLGIIPPLHTAFSNEIAVLIPDCKPTPVPIPKPVPVSTPKPTPGSIPSPATKKIPSWMNWGAYTGWERGSMTEFEKLTGKVPHMEMVFMHWADETSFPFYSGIHEKGQTMVLFWEASDYRRNPFNQPEFSFDAVLAGNLDQYFKKFAEGARAYGGPIILIPYSEFNGEWMPWGGGVGSNTPQKLIDSYRYIHSFFKGIPNVKFGWVPNSVSVPNIPTNALELYYPGDDVVDYVGVDGFNFGGSEEVTFDQLFGSTLTRLKVYKKPIYIFSMATAEGPGKASWIIDALTVQLPKYPEVSGFLWFNQNKERDWRISSDPNSLQAFINALP